MTRKMAMLTRWFDECDEIIRSSKSQSEISFYCKTQTTVVQLMIKLNREEKDV